MFNVCPAGNTIVHFEIEAVKEEGRRSTLNPERLFPSLGVGTTRMTFMLSGVAAAASGDRPSNDAVARCRDVLLAIGRAHAQRFATQAQRLEVIRVETKFDGTAKRETVYGVDLP